MLSPLIIKATDDTPKVVFDHINNLFEISGRSLPEDASKFYNPLKSWITNYLQNPNPLTEIKFDLDYFNSSSARLIVKILIELENLNNSEFKTKIIWKYKVNDEVMKERGEEIKNVINIPLEFETYS